MEGNPRITQDTKANVTSEWKGILELHKILRQQSNDTQSIKSARYQR